MRSIKRLAATVALFAALSPPAFAQNPTDDAYGNPLVSGLGAKGQPTMDRKESGGASLPFTGFQIAVLVLAGGGLILLAVRLRRYNDGDQPAI